MARQCFLVIIVHFISFFFSIYHLLLSLILSSLILLLVVFLFVATRAESRSNLFAAGAEASQSFATGAESECLFVWLGISC